MLGIPTLPANCLADLRQRSRAAFAAIPSPDRARFRSHLRSALRLRLVTPAEVVDALRSRPTSNTTPADLLFRATERWTTRAPALVTLRNVAPISYALAQDTAADPTRRTLLRGAIRRSLVSPATVLDALTTTPPGVTPLRPLLQEAFAAIAASARDGARRLARNLGLRALPALALPSWTVQPSDDTGPVLVSWLDPPNLLRFAPTLELQFLFGLNCDTVAHPLGDLFQALASAHRAVPFTPPQLLLEQVTDGFDYLTEVISDALRDFAFPTTRASRDRAIELALDGLLASGEIDDRDEAEHMLPEIERVLDLLDLRGAMAEPPPPLSSADKRRLNLLRSRLERWFTALQEAPQVSEEIAQSVLWDPVRHAYHPASEELLAPWLALLPPSDAVTETLNTYFDDRFNSGFSVGVVATHTDGEPLLAAVERLTHEIALWGVLAHALAGESE